MLIALVFMMFCAFIGGAVLAAATANAGRIDALNTETQDYLDQRSICMLLVDELQSGDFGKLNISIEDSVITPMQERTVDGEAIINQSGSPVHEIKVKADNPDDKDSQLRQLLYGCAVMRYFKQQGNQIDNDTVITLDGFNYLTKDDLLKLFSINPESFSMKVTDPLGNTIDAFFKCSADNKNMYSLQIDFGDATQMSIQMKATPDVGSSRTIDTNKTPGGGYVNFDRVTYKTTTISWDTAYIEKGGLA